MNASSSACGFCVNLTVGVPVEIQTKLVEMVRGLGFEVLERDLGEVEFVVRVETLAHRDLVRNVREAYCNGFFEGLIAGINAGK